MTTNKVVKVKLAIHRKRAFEMPLNVKGPDNVNAESKMYLRIFMINISFVHHKYVFLEPKNVFGTNISL